MNAYLVIEKNWFGDVDFYLDENAEKKNVCIALTKEDAEKAISSEKSKLLERVGKWNPVVDGNSVTIEGCKVSWEIVAIPLYS